MSANAINGFAIANGQWINQEQTNPITIVVLNLMPNKAETECQFLASFAKLAQDVEITFAYPVSHHFKSVNQNTVANHYACLAEIEHRHFDGLIITGAPVETLGFEQVDYWQEFCAFCRWATTHTRASLVECWAALGGLYHDYGINKHRLNHKLFGVYQATKLDASSPLVDHFATSQFQIPQSRHSTCNCSLNDVPTGVKVVANNQAIGPLILQAPALHRTYITGHPEYSKDTLAKEYQRDLKKHLPIEAPCNYFTNDHHINYSWRFTSELLYQNWVNTFAPVAVTN
ncbi:homoserine O-acetyltransferase/O-succinyltransferase family protein [Limosilactobacillus caecicola]|uniref:homoserine O-acetyltransferase/O-succinyltransferase family protein n=1 Tax=Limosilactobacillus caecicola TaxID=2941332 RepID=UPI0020409FC5|nr:homoserine O-succinyltransferase [Limosilactobacillus caecicola]